MKEERARRASASAHAGRAATHQATFRIQRITYDPVEPRPPRSQAVASHVPIAVNLILNMYIVVDKIYPYIHRCIEI